MMNLIQNNRRGFTLAELMAVVVIIGIIAVIGLGSYSKSVVRAKVNEGKILAQQVAAARDAYVYDREGAGGSATIPTSFSVLDLDFKNKSGSSPTSSVWQTNDFNVYISNKNYVKVTPTDDSGYTIYAYQEANGGNGRMCCTGNEDLCKSGGMRYAANSAC